jgi:hypothetical protein
MGKHAKMNFDLLRTAGSTPQGRCESSFKPRNRTFGLHPLTIFDFGKIPIHLPPILALRPTPPPSFVDFDHGTADAQDLAGQDMVVFCIVGGIRQKSVDAYPPTSPLQDRTQQWSVVAWTVVHDGVNQQVRRVVACQCHLWPTRNTIAFLPDFLGIMRRSMSCLQPRGIYTGFLFHAHKGLLPGVVENCVEQPVEQTFFRRRCCAL